MLKIISENERSQWQQSLGETASWYNFSKWHKVILSDSIVADRELKIRNWIIQNVNDEVFCFENIIIVDPPQIDVDFWEKKLKSLRKKEAEQIKTMDDRINQAIQCDLEISKLEKELDEVVDWLGNQPKPKFRLLSTKTYEELMYHKQDQIRQQLFAEIQKLKIEKKHKDELLGRDFSVSKRLSMTKDWEKYRPQPELRREGWKFMFANELHAVEFKLTWV